MAESEAQTLEEKILAVLRSATKPLTPPEIALQVGFKRPNNKASTVNPTLYKLLERGEIVRTTNEQGNKPHYAIATSATSSG